jgi:CSLREA domain-containing protein
MNRLVKILFGFCFVLCLSHAAFAATFTVTKIADTNDGTCDADCSLREAVAAAIAAASDDVIEFSSLFNTAQTITLSGTNILITANGTLTINGPGANLLTVSGGASRVFTVSAATATISNLRVTGGNGISGTNNGLGGGIRLSGGTLTLNNLVVTGNTATNGGIFYVIRSSNNQVETHPFGAVGDVPAASVFVS